MGKIPVQPTEDFWSVLRESQCLALNLPQTGMVVTVDIGDGSLHPKDKRSVGERLALLAENNIYKKDVTCLGPVLEKFKISNDSIVLTFNANGKGLTSRTDSLKGFAIADESKQFKWATAKISGNKVLLLCSGVSHPTAVRYGWGENPICTLSNTEGLPASPFRTDNWPVKTDGTW
jgi:sialate O-acetylesterase